MKHADALFTGIRIAVVNAIGTAVFAAFVGGGGLGGVAAQHQQLDVCSTQHLLISGGQHGGGKAVHLFQITLLPHARRLSPKNSRLA